MSDTTTTAAEICARCAMRMLTATRADTTDRLISVDPDDATRMFIQAAQVHATLAQVEATREQTAVLQGFLDFVKAQDAQAADELRQTGPCGNPTWLHDSTDCPCKTEQAGA